MCMECVHEREGGCVRGVGVSFFFLLNQNFILN